MVLLIDRDDDFRQALVSSLTDDGHSVRAFGRPADVPPFASFEGVTMLVLDYAVDGDDGLALADRFHRVHPDVPVVMVAAYVSRHLEAEAGARDFMTLRRKPVDYEDLARLLPPRH
ncbi:MAG: response regulator [Candidatus Binatia bacterium]